MKFYLRIILITLIFFNYLNCSLAARYTIPQSILVIDINNGKILQSRNAYKKVRPASLTKLMTIYQTFRAVKEKKINFNTKLRVSINATNMPSAKLDINPNTDITVLEAIKALIVVSANDVAVALAENLASSEEKFVKMMNVTAKKLNMKNTHFCNASGLHNKYQYTTSIDMARLALSLKRDFPEYYNLFAQKQFYFNGNIYNTHNYVTQNYQGAEGLKTGYTKLSGYNLVTIAKRQNKSLLGVIIGEKSAKFRDKKMIDMLDRHFAMLVNNRIRNKFFKKKFMMKKCLANNYRKKNKYCSKLMKLNKFHLN